MRVSSTRQVQAARKKFSCDWCNELIDIGKPYATWFTYAMRTCTRMHPECYEASLKADLYDEELPPAGTYRRGCSEEE